MAESLVAEDCRAVTRDELRRAAGAATILSPWATVASFSTGINFTGRTDTLKVSFGSLISTATSNDLRMEAGFSLEMMRRWFAKSGIQAPAGGIYGWLAASTGEGAYLYSEITGYAINLYVQLARDLGDVSWLGRAEKAFRWLESEALNNWGVYCAGARVHDSRFRQRSNQVFSFDNGVILHGLLQLYTATQEKPILVRAKAIGDWLVQECLEQNGDLRPLFVLDRAAYQSDGAVWSQSTGGYHAKVAMALTYLSRITAVSDYDLAARRICDRILARQRPDGRFVTYDTLSGTNAHPLCYAAEGLWFCAGALEDERYVQAARRAAHWLLRQIDSEGLVPRLWVEEPGGEVKVIRTPRADVLAQALRLSCLFPEVGESTGVARLEGALRSFQVKDGPEHQRGGFRYGFLSSGQPTEHINWWVTAFAYQALSLRAAPHTLALVDMV